MDSKDPEYTPPIPSKSRQVFSIPWEIFDTLVLFRLGSTYLHRFKDFSRTTHEIEDVALHEDITLWRREQQEEWDRLSVTVCLTSMNMAVETCANALVYFLTLGP